MERARSLFARVVLVVGVHGDADTIAHKGAVVLSLQERIDLLKHIKLALLVAFSVSYLLFSYLILSYLLIASI